MEAVAERSELQRARPTELAPISRARPGLLFWLIGLGAWTALALLSATETAMSLAYRGQPIDWARLLTFRVIDWYTCALFIPPFLWLVRRAPLERASWRRRLPLYVVVTLAATLARYALTIAMQRRFFGGDDRSLSAVLASNAITELMIFWAVVGVLHAVEFYRRYREREAIALELRAQLSESQLHALRAQLHPHFLFNALNAATTLVHRDPEAADRMLTRLGELLRHALRSDAGHETSLREELALLDRYLDIMSTRFGDQLTIRRQVPPSLEDAIVPTFVLQPLVENALEHGVSRMDGAGYVEIEAARDGDHLVLAVRDNGSHDLGAAHDGLGIGLANTRARLAALYGSGAELRLRPRATGGMEAVLRLPLRQSPTP